MAVLKVGIRNSNADNACVATQASGAKILCINAQSPVSAPSPSPASPYKTTQYTQTHTRGNKTTHNTLHFIAHGTYHCGRASVDGIRLRVHLRGRRHQLQLRVCLRHVRHHLTHLHLTPQGHPHPHKTFYVEEETGYSRVALSTCRVSKRGRTGTRFSGRRCFPATNHS
jgi:hypothetical protein